MTADHPTCSSSAYRRRRPEHTPLHRAVAEHLSNLQARLAHEGKTLPNFVNLTFTRYLTCGQLEGGFARLYCAECTHNRLKATL